MGRKACQAQDQNRPVKLNHGHTPRATDLRSPHDSADFRDSYLSHHKYPAYTLAIAPTGEFHADAAPGLSMQDYTDLENFMQPPSDGLFQVVL
jgi:hypothetical protein